MKTALSVIILFVACTGYAQIPQRDRYRERMDRSIKASEDAEHDRRLAESDKLPTPKKAVMNVDVQMVVTKAEYRSFAEARAAAAGKFLDGEPAWLFVRFNGKLGDYVLTTRDPDDPEKLLYTLFAELAPRGDVTALHQVTLRFAKEDLALPELKINLAPGSFGRNKSIPSFLQTAGEARSGVWNNEVRLTNNTTVPRDLTENLATAAVTLDLSSGGVRYRKMESEYDSMVIRGSTDPARLPVPGTFFNESLRSRIAARVEAEGIKPAKIYFSGDGWLESASFAVETRKSRKVFATVTYRSGEKCFYRLARVVEQYDFVRGKYGETQIALEEALPLACRDIY